MISALKPQHRASNFFRIADSVSKSNYVKPVDRHDRPRFHDQLCCQILRSPHHSIAPPGLARSQIGRRRQSGNRSGGTQIPIRTASNVVEPFHPNDVTLVYARMEWHAIMIRQNGHIRTRADRLFFPLHCRFVTISHNSWVTFNI
jgi:hypothetical protein